MSLAGCIKLTFGKVSAVDAVEYPNLVADSRATERKTSRFHGVTWDVNAGKWKVEIEKFGRIIVLGHYSQEEVGAWAYDQVARRPDGPSAKLNFPAISDH